MHKVFISHHHRNDQYFKNELAKLGKRCSIFVDRSVHTSGISDDLTDQQIRREIRDKYLRDSTVTVLLVGTEAAEARRWEIYSSMYDGAVNKKSGVVVINLPGISIGECTAPHGTEEKKLLYPNVASWTHVDTRAEYERRYPYMPDRIVDNLLKRGVTISVTSWDTVDGSKERLKFLIDAAFANRANCPYDLSEPMRRANS